MDKCEYCNKDYSKKKSNQKYCSVICREKNRESIINVYERDKLNNDERLMYCINKKSLFFKDILLIKCDNCQCNFTPKYERKENKILEICK